VMPIIYAACYGTTGACANLLSDALQGKVTVQNLAENPAGDLTGLETVVIRSSVYAGRLNKRLGFFTCNREEGRLKQLHAVMKKTVSGCQLTQQLGCSFFVAAFRKRLLIATPIPCSGKREQTMNRSPMPSSFLIAQ